MAQPYVSPLTAGLQPIMQYLTNREATKRQQMLDQIAQSREQRLAQNDIEDQKIRQAELKLRTDEATSREFERQRNEHLKILANMQPGDIPDAKTIADAQKFGTTDLLKKTPSQTFASQGGTPAAPVLGGQTATPMGEPTVPSDVRPADLGGIREPIRITTPVGPTKFAGTPQQRKQAEQDKAQDDYISSLPAGSPERRALEYEKATGKNAPAGMFRGEQSTSRGVFRQNPKEGTVERMVDGQWVPWKGDVPEGSHWMTTPDNSSREAAQHEASYKFNATRLDKIAKPYEDQVERIDRLNSALSANAPITDALVPPELLSVMVGGGVGLRMSETELRRIIGARSNWDSLKVALQKWGSDPSKALSLSPQQRADMQKLAAGLSTYVHGRLSDLSDAQQRLIDATDATEHKQVVADIRKKFSQGEGKTDTGADTEQPGDVVYGMDGKPIKKGASNRPSETPVAPSAAPAAGASTIVPTQSPSEQRNEGIARVVQAGATGKLNIPGLITPGNIDLTKQPKVANPGGGTSTVFSSSHDFDGKSYLLPAVTPDGRFLKTDKEIEDEFRKTGRHLGVFTNHEAADKYGEQLHNEYVAGKYDTKPGDIELPASGVVRVTAPSATKPTQSPETPSTTHTLSKQGAETLKGPREGGFQADAYPDANGYAVAYGMQTWKGKKVTQGLHVDQKEADAEFDRQIKEVYAPIVDNNLKVPVTQKTYDTLISIAWNHPATAIKVIKKMNAGERVTLEDLMQSATVNGEPNQGLANRRQDEFSGLQE